MVRERGPHGSEVLQWGRDQLVAEIAGSRVTNTRRSGCFNGAATNWSRKWIITELARRG